jgi:hypothetical protein
MVIPENNAFEAPAEGSGNKKFFFLKTDAIEV